MGVQVAMEMSPRVGIRTPRKPVDWYFSSETAEEHEKNKWNRLEQLDNVGPPSPPKPSCCGVLWEKGEPSSGGEEMITGAVKPPLRGIGLPSFYRAFVDKKLVLRSAAALDSQKVGDIKSGTFVTVLEEIRLDNHDIRARVGKDTSPRGLGGFDLGWVTAVKDGESKLVPLVSLTSEAAMPQSASWSRLRSYDASGPLMDPSFSRLDASGSMASRIAAKRRSRRQTSRTTKMEHEAPAPETTPPEEEEMKSEKSEKKKKSNKAPEFELKSSTELKLTAERMREEADECDAVQFDTTRSKLGMLLFEKGAKIDEIMLEWDRNRDGEISLQEFRLNVRKLGLTEKEAPTKEIDSIYHSIDLDGSGTLDMKEVKVALKKLQEEHATVDQREEQQRVRASSKRRLAESFSNAVAATIDFEEASKVLAKMRDDQDMGAKLGELIKRRNIKVSELVGTWDEDGSGYIDRKEFRVHVRLVGLDATDKDLDQIFDQLDSDGSEALDPKELPVAFRRLLSASAQHKNNCAEEAKRVAKKKKEAETLQKEAFAAVATAEASLNAVEEEARLVHEAKAAKEAKARREKEDAKREEKRRALERQKTSMMALTS